MDVNNKTMSFFSHKKRFSVFAQVIKFWKYYGKSKNKFSNFLSYRGPKRFVGREDFQIWSQNWVWIIFYSYFGQKKNTQKRWNCDPGLFWRFFGQNVFKLNSGIMFRILSSRRTFSTAIWKRIWKFNFWLPLVFSKFYILCANRKSSFYERKMKLFCYSRPMARD